MEYNKDNVHIFTSCLEKDSSYIIHICIDKGNIGLHFWYDMINSEVYYFDEKSILLYAQEKIKEVSHIIGATIRTVLPLL